jgi:hypothetical protein
MPRNKQPDAVIVTTVHATRHECISGKPVRIDDLLADAPLG